LWCSQWPWCEKSIVSMTVFMTTMVGFEEESVGNVWIISIYETICLWIKLPCLHIVLFFPSGWDINCNFCVNKNYASKNGTLIAKN
jgi:hypothetical protein